MNSKLINPKQVTRYSSLFFKEKAEQLKEFPEVSQSDSQSSLRESPIVKMRVVKIKKVK